jgi:hypothetical protein
MNKVLFSNVTKKDSRLLVSWWNANTSFQHFRQFVYKFHGKSFYNIIRYV